MNECVGGGLQLRLPSLPSHLYCCIAHFYFHTNSKPRERERMGGEGGVNITSSEAGEGTQAVGNW